MTQKKHSHSDREFDISDTVRTIELHAGSAVTFVDASDFDSVSRYKWYLSRVKNSELRYARRKEAGRFVILHRFIMGAKFGQIIDHINGNGLDNRRANLRFCTTAENIRNQRKSKNKSGFKGVTEVNGRWRAMIRVNYLAVSLGVFSTPEQAALAYDNAARRYFKEFARTNF